MIRGIHHIAISTPNLTRSVEFYTSQLGFEVAGGGQWRDSETLDRHMGLRSSAGRTATLRLGAAMLEIFEFESPPSAPTAGDRPVSDHGLTHICLDVTDLDAEYERLRAAGMRFHAPPLDADVMKVRSVYGRDPDGNVIELQQILDESSPMAVSEAVSEAVSD